MILPADKLTPVSVFEIPKDYVENTYRVDDPMDNWMTAWVLRFSNELFGRDMGKSDPDKRYSVDLRFNDPVEGETFAKNYHDWIEKFKEHGQRFAWGEHNIGGVG